MLRWIVAIVVALAVGALLTWLAHGPLRKRDQTAAGIAALSAMSWREFIRVVLEALSRRGYHRLQDHESDAVDGDYSLVRNGERWLLSAKHGSAFVLGRSAVNELAAAMAVSDAPGGLLVTQGRIDDDARRAVHGRTIELLDGPALWPELRPLLPPAAVQPIEDASARRARERSLGGWLLALVAGIVVFLLLPAPRVSTATEAAPSAAAAPAVQDAPAAFTAPDAATFEAQRRELAGLVATLPVVSRALWSSASTLEIVVQDSDGDPFDAICPLVDRYPALAASRIQLTPPPGSGRAVRFRQCRSY